MKTKTNKIIAFLTLLLTLFFLGGIAEAEAAAFISDWETTTPNETITLPMPGETESLNAAVAGAIALYLVFHK